MCCIMMIIRLFEATVSQNIQSDCCCNVRYKKTCFHACRQFYCQRTSRFVEIKVLRLVARDSFCVVSVVSVVRPFASFRDASPVEWLPATRQLLCCRVRILQVWRGFQKRSSRVQDQDSFLFPPSRQNTFSLYVSYQHLYNRYQTTFTLHVYVLTSGGPVDGGGERDLYSRLLSS